MDKTKTVILESGIEVPIAVYKDQGTIDYNGNPFIEALPPILSRDEAFDQLYYLPPYHENERNLSPKHRYHALLRLTQFFQNKTSHPNKLQIIINKGEKNKKSAYEALLEEGYIKNPINDFIS